MNVAEIVQQSDTRAGRIFDWTVIGLIVISIFTLSIDTMPDLSGTARELRKRTLEQAEQAAEARRRLKADVKTEKEALETAGLQLTGACEREEEARSKVDGLRGGVRQSETALTEADEAVSWQISQKAIGDLLFGYG